jgi:hypothetical protein
MYVISTSHIRLHLPRCPFCLHFHYKILQTFLISTTRALFPFYTVIVGFSGLVVSMLASGTQVRGFKSGWSRRIFRVEKKILSMPSFGGEVKPAVPRRRFAACKRSLHLPWKSHAVGKIWSAISHPYFPPSLIRGLWRWRGKLKAVHIGPMCIGAAGPRFRPLLYSTSSSIFWITLIISLSVQEYTDLLQMHKCQPFC